MQTTMHLLEKALSIEPNTAELCRKIETADSAIRVARHNGRLTPVIAGNLASFLGEDVTHWIAVAAIESAPDTPSKRRLESSLKNWRKRSHPPTFINNKCHTKQYGFFMVFCRICCIRDGFA